MLHSYLTLKIKPLIFDSLKQADDSLDFAHSTLQRFPGNVGLKLFHSIALFMVHRSTSYLLQN